jgi:hypothetical protein
MILLHRNCHHDQPATQVNQAADHLINSNPRFTPHAEHHELSQISCLYKRRRSQNATLSDERGNFSGPTTPTNASPEFSPNIATATAIASSKLVPAAVNELEKILNLLQNEQSTPMTGLLLLMQLSQSSIAHGQSS